MLAKRSNPPEAYVPTWNYDVFVSYAHKDDRVWIEEFIARLDLGLRQAKNIETKFFLDEASSSQSRDFTRNIPDELNRSGVFLLLLSPSYLRSTYCVQVECRSFRESINDRRSRYGPPEFGNENFAICCEILASREEATSELLPGCSPLTFYDDPDALSPAPFDSPICKSSLRTLTSVLGKLLERMRSSYAKVFVYPLTPGPEIKVSRAEIVQELTARGYWVLPDVETTLEQQMETADLSVFLLGERYDAITYKLTEKAKTLGKRWVVWRTSFANSLRAEPAQAAFSAKFPLADPYLTFLDAVYNSGEVKREILDLLDRPKKRPIAGPAKPSVYVVYKPGDEVEKISAGEIRIKCGTEFNFVYFDPGRHPQLLRESDGVLLVWATAEESWVGGQFLAMEQVGKARSFGLCLFTPPERMSDGLRLIRDRNSSLPIHIAEQIRDAFDPVLLEDFFRPLRIRSSAD